MNTFVDQEGSMVSYSIYWVHWMYLIFSLELPLRAIRSDIPWWNHLGLSYGRWLLWGDRLRVVMWQDPQVFSCFSQNQGCWYFQHKCGTAVTWWSPSLRLTGNFPRGCITDLLIAHGDIRDGNKLSGCLFSDWRNPCPAMEISVPESQRAETDAWPFNEDIWISMVNYSRENVWF